MCLCVESLGDCSFLNTCFHMETCKYVHYTVDYPPPSVGLQPKSDTRKSGADGQTTLFPQQVCLLSSLALILIQ